MQLSANVFASRRKKLLESMEEGSAMLLFGAKHVLRNGDAEYPYRQDSDLWYLTGWKAPESALLLVPGAEEESVLFVQPKNPEMEIWTGIRPGTQGAVAEFGVDAAYAWETLQTALTSRLQGIQTLYFSVGLDSERDALVMGAIRRARRAVRANHKCLPDAFIHPGRLVHEMRLRKSPEEVVLLKEAARITGEAHRGAMEMAKEGLNEFHLHAFIDYTFRKHGGNGPGYTSIVGAGNNACILHYIENDKPLQSGDLVLIDAGCELENYCADVTRTFPVSGKFSAEQRAVYEVVLRANEAVIQLVRKGTPFKALQECCIRVLTEGLVELGLLHGEVEELIEAKAHRPFYMHGVSHYLGMDVHDVGRYSADGESRPLEEGMVLTVEPGIYISPDNGDVPEKWRGIGIRIEDDVLVGSDGPVNLTEGIPKTVEAVEEACSSTAS